MNFVRIIWRTPEIKFTENLIKIVRKISESFEKISGKYEQNLYKILQFMGKIL